MKNLKWIPPLMMALFALPVFAQPLVMEDRASADLKAQIYESQVAETSGASIAVQTDNGGPGSLTAEDMQASPSTQDQAAASAAKEQAAEPAVAANEHAGVSTGHPEKPAGKPEHKRVHFVKQAKKKTS